MPVGRTSDSMMVSTLRLSYWWDGRGLMLWLFVGPTRVYLLDFFCSCIQFYLLLSPYLYFISLLYFDLYVLGDDALISQGSFTQTKYLCVLIHIWIKGEVGASWNRFKPSSKMFYWPFQGGTSFVDLLCLCSVLCLLWLCARLFICALWSPAGKLLTSWLSFVVSNCEFVTFPLVSWVRFGTWLYLFLIFAPLLTLLFKFLFCFLVIPPVQSIQGVYSFCLFCNYVCLFVCL